MSRQIDKERESMDREKYRKKEVFDEKRRGMDR